MGPMTTLLPSGMDRGSLIPRTGGTTKKSTQGQGDQNLVEMTVYGIATLYRRPDPPKTDGQIAQPGQPSGGVPTTQPAVAPTGGAAKK